MMMRRLTTVAELLAAVLAMGSSSVQAQAKAGEFIRIVPQGSDLDTSFAGTNITVVALNGTTDGTIEIGITCGGGESLPPPMAIEVLS